MIRAAFLLRLALLCAALAFAATDAHALTCATSTTPLSFGSVDVLSGQSFDAVGTLTISCTGGPTESGHVVRLCASIGAGDSTGAPPRSLRNGNATLLFELYPAASGNAPWGAWSGGYGSHPGVQADMPLVNGQGTIELNIYGTIFPGQQRALPGAYLATFNDAATAFTYAVDAGATPCNSVVGETARYSFTAAATVQPNCLISANDLNFGTVLDLAQPVDAQTTIDLTCSSGLAFMIGLDGGRSQAADPGNRQMTSGPSSLAYGLYRDAARALPWGSRAGVDAYAGTGTALLQSIPVYGRILGGQTPAAGVYSDIIVVTVTY